MQDVLQLTRQPTSPRRLDEYHRRLWNRGQIVALTPKAMDTLLVLVEQAGHVVDRDDLLQTICPDTFVSEETLTQNIATIRRALGDSLESPKYVATVFPGETRLSR